VVLSARSEPVQFLNEGDFKG